MTTQRYLAVICLLVLSACTHQQQAVKGSPIAEIVGADRDKHGCIGSAGYTWCGRELACVRSWELATQKGFEATEEAFNQYCSSP